MDHDPILLLQTTCLSFLDSCLLPLHLLWADSSIYHRISLFIGFSLVVPLMEGAWWTFFRWFDRLWILGHYCRSLLHQHYIDFLVTGHQLYHSDVRFWVDFTIIPRRYCRRATNRTRHYGITVKLKRYETQPYRPSSELADDIATHQKLEVLANISCLARQRRDKIQRLWLTDLERASTRPFQEQLEPFPCWHPNWTWLSIAELFGDLDPLEWFDKERELLTTFQPPDQSHWIQRANYFTACLNNIQAQSRNLPSLESGKSYIAPERLLLNKPKQKKRDREADPRCPIVIDTGASVSITPILEDFVTPLDKTNIPEMRGVTELVQVIGTGTVEWTIRAPDNRICIIRTQAHYIPTADIRLFSPQTYFREQSNGSFCEFDHNSITLHLKHQGRYSFPFHYMGNTPLMEPVLESVARSFYPSDPQAFDPIIAGLTQHHLFDLEHRLADTQSLLDSNHNLSPGCKELLLWHNRFAHAGFSWIQDLMRPRKNEVGERADPGFIKARIPQAHRCAAPKCPACLLSRQHRRTPDSTRHVPNKAREMAI